MDKKLYKITQGKVICGVCGGVAEYFNIDPTLVRVGWAVLCCFAGAGVLAYIVAAVVMPEKPTNIVDQAE